MDAENRKPENFDAWLDAALQVRGEAEPRSGLEDRVLARLAAEPPRRGFVWWPVLAAVSAILLVAIALAVFRTEEHRQQIAGPPPAAIVPAPKTQAPPLVAAKAPSIPRFGAHRHLRDAAKEVEAANRRAQNERLPKMATFPSARPETSQERMLAKLGAQGGPMTVTELQERPVSDFAIQPMEETPADNTPQE